MIHRTHRFHGHNSLRFVYQKGQTIRGPFLAIKYIANQRRKSYRLAIVVSRKVSKSAVTRNRIRRRIYELLRAEQQRIAEPYDIVLTAFNEQLATLEPDELRHAVLVPLEKAGVLKKVDR
jgi:ribonuclease P protein component